jgi:hypothetical protein
MNILDRVIVFEDGSFVTLREIINDWVKDSSAKVEDILIQLEAA